MTALDPFGFEGPEGRWLEETRESRWQPQLGSAGPYELLEEIGRGGQGIVYRARRDGSTQQLAVKRLTAGPLAGQEVRSRLEREARAVARLDHPAIVRLHGLEMVSGQPVLEMDYVDGTLLTDWAAQLRSPSGWLRSDLRRVLQVFLEVCRGVQHAHQRGVIHRDLKPSNILVDRQHRSHILDFGLARLLDEENTSLTGSADFLGTPAYAAPEQLLEGAQRADTRSDIFALGTLLEEILTGQHPCGPVHNLGDLLKRFESGDRQPPSNKMAGISAELDQIIARAVEKEPDRRYPSMDAFAEDLERHLRGEPIQAHGPGFRERLVLLVLRRRWPLALVATVLLFSVGFALYAWNAADQLRRQSNDAQAARIAAEEEAGKASAVKDFLLQGLLLPADPLLAGSDVSLHELVLEAAPRIEEHFEDPLMAAAVHELISGLFSRIGNQTQAKHHALRSLELFRTQRSDPHPEVANAHLRLAKVHYVCNELREAQQVLEKVFLVEPAQANVFLQCRAHSLLARILTDGGNLERAESHCRQGLELLSTLEDADSLEGIPLRISLSRILTGRWEYDAAEDLLQEGHEQVLQELGRDHHLLAELWKQRARVAKYAGDVQRTEQYYENALQVLERCFPENDPTAEPVTRGLILTELGDLLVKYHRVEEGERFLRQARQFFLARGENETPSFAIVLEALGVAQFHRSDFAQAESLHRQALKILQGSDQRLRQLVNLRRSLANIRRVRGHPGDAVRLERLNVADLAGHLGEDHPELAVCKANLAVLLGPEESGGEAEKLFREAISVLQSHGTGAFLPELMMSWSQFLYDLERTEEAIEAGYEAVGLGEEQFGADAVVTARIKRDLGRLFVLLEQGDEAVPLLQESLDSLLGQPVEQHIEIARTLSWLARGLALEGQEEQAKNLLLRYQSDWSEQLGSSHPSYRLLAQVLEELGNR